MTRPSLLISLIALSACGDSIGPFGPNPDPQPAGPPTYTLMLSVPTTGYAIGGDFSFTVDGQPGTVGPNRSVSVRGLRAGTHNVVLHVRPDCRATDPMRVVNVSGDTSVQFEVTCFGWGTVRVFTESLGASPWGGHVLEFVVGDVGVPLFANGTTVERLVAGQYWPVFTPARNCSGRTSLGLIDLQADEEVELRLQATCDPVGTLRVAFSSTGEDLPSGIVWDAVHVGTAAVERLRLLSGSKTDFMLAPGDWTGQLVQLPENCQPTSANPASISIAESQVTEIAVSIECVRYTGWLRVTLTTTGPAASFGLNLGGSCTTLEDALGDFCTWLKPNGSELVELYPRSYDVHVTAFGPRVCAVSPKDPIVAEVRTGVITDVAFTINCV